MLKGMLLSNAKASIEESSITLVLLVLTSVICMLWIMKTLDPDATEAVDRIHYDLENIKIKLSTACNSNTYSGSYNPRMEQGNLSISGPEICIESGAYTSCSFAVCDTGLQEEISLEDASTLSITRDGGGMFHVS